MNALRIFAFSAVATLTIWVATAFGMGWSGLMAVVILTFLEIVFSFDNAIVNAKLLAFLPPFWQKLFLTVGIFIAVFVVRFALPVVIVSLTAGLGFFDTIELALSDPEKYSHELEKAMPAISAFGGMFLNMIAIGYFLDAAKKVHWIGAIEHRLAKLGRYDNVGIVVMLLITIVVVSTMSGDFRDRFIVLIAAVAGITLNMLLGIFDVSEEDGDEVPDAPPGAQSAVRLLVGGAAALMFLRLEVVDASFSFDGVIGAFALTSNVVVIMAGLGAGALWVRSLTVYFQRTGALLRFRYLEHGAHWAIGALGVIMLVKGAYHVEPPEWVIGPIGLLFILAALWSSISKRRHTKDREKVLA